MIHATRTMLPLVGFVLLAASAAAQTNVEWAEFANQTASRLVNNPAAGSVNHATDIDEKDYAWGDLDRDGDLDLVGARKEMAATLGKRVTALFMNEGVKEGRPADGVLVDRAANLATASDVGGDLGFLQPTNTRDVEIADVNGDGWLDVVMCMALNDGDPKHLSHPRVYINRGVDGSGNWLGLRFENSRIPQLLTVGGLAVAPRFCDLAVGDVDNDGDVDLYFTDYDSTETNIPEPAANDLNDRLLINDGTGVFSDQSATRMTATMLSSAFGMACEIADMNGDGFKDIVKDTALGTPQYVSVSYNNPLNPGFFNIFQNNAYTGQPYHVATGDLNGDGRLDLAIGDDGQDRYRLNNGNDALGRVVWSTAFATTYAGGSDDGFPGNTLIADLDNDGFPEVLIADVDVDVPGCSRRAHLFHNLANVPNVTLREEAQSTGTSTGWKGAKGLLVGDLQGTFDIAPFDIDGDGWRDLVIGRCTGTAVWMNKPKGLERYGVGTPTAQHNIVLTGNRLPKLNTPSFKLVAYRGPANAAGLLAVSDVQDLAGTFVPALGATLHIGLATPNLLVLPMNTDAQGTAELPIAIPSDPGLVGLTFFGQYAVFDGPALRTSNGLKLVFQN